MSEWDDCDLDVGLDLDFDLDFDLGFGPKRAREPLPHAAAMAKARERHRTRRAMSEAAMNEVLDWHLEDGVCYHVITGGDVDALTFLRGVVKQQRLDYCLVSTWCMAMTDAKEMVSWMDAGYVERMDLYIGEIFISRDPDIYETMRSAILPRGGRVALLRNHAKVMLCYGEEFDCAIASSANVNTNPRMENTTITVDTEVADFYKGFFDSLHPYNPEGEPEGWEPWSRPISDRPRRKPADAPTKRMRKCFKFIQGGKADGNRRRERGHLRHHRRGRASEAPQEVEAARGEDPRADTRRGAEPHAHRQL